MFLLEQPNGKASLEIIGHGLNHIVNKLLMFIFTRCVFFLLAQCLPFWGLKLCFYWYALLAMFSMHFVCLCRKVIVYSLDYKTDCIRIRSINRREFNSVKSNNAGNKKMCIIFFYLMPIWMILYSQVEKMLEKEFEDYLFGSLLNKSRSCPR